MVLAHCIVPHYFILKNTKGIKCEREILSLTSPAPHLYVFGLLSEYLFAAALPRTFAQYRFDVVGKEHLSLYEYLGNLLHLLGVLNQYQYVMSPDAPQSLTAKVPGVG